MASPINKKRLVFKYKNKTNCEPYQQVDNVVRTKVRTVVVFIVLAAIVVNGRWKGDI